MFFRSKNKSTNAFNAAPQLIKLQQYPPQMKECFELLKAANLKYFALFGGAVRDADYNARHQQSRVIKDYDIRIWLPSDNYQQQLKTFIAELTLAAKTDICPTPSPGTDKVRYCLNFQGVELDISVRPIPESIKNLSLEAVAIDRAGDCDVGISAVAIDSLGRAWARQEYIIDQTIKTLTVYPNENEARKLAYAKRMKEKFPDHVLAWGREGDEFSVLKSSSCRAAV